ncbi:MAG: hypothetical protein AB2689_14070 [Candidatus Thiodiazotropha taylori]
MIDSIGQKTTSPFTLLKKRSPYHPNKRGRELDRFGNPEFNTQASVLLDILSESYPVYLTNDDDLAISILHSCAFNQQTSVDTTTWHLSGEGWCKLTCLGQWQIERCKKSLIDSGALLQSLEGYPAKAFYQYVGKNLEDAGVSNFTFYPGLSSKLGFKSAALFCWLLKLDNQFETQGYFFHLKMADIQQSLGLSRYQVDQARKKLIEHNLLKERFWGIPAVREFRLRLDGLEQLVAEKGTSE